MTIFSLGKTVQGNLARESKKKISYSIIFLIEYEIDTWTDTIEKMHSEPTAAAETAYTKTMRRSESWLILAMGLLLWPRPASAQSRFEAVFQRAIADQVLDKQDLTELEILARAPLEPEDRFLAAQLFEMFRQYPSVVRLSFGYTFSHQYKRVNFVLTRSYAESDRLPKASPAQMLAQISQQDALAETQSDGVRCGAAALMAAAFLYDGRFYRVDSANLNYHQLHLAQEALYQLSNVDGIEGLNQSVEYLQQGNWLRAIRNQGEINTAASLLNLKLTPLPLELPDTPLMRARLLRRIWDQDPQSSLLTGVFLSGDGKILAPNRFDRLQNHFVLIFRQAGRLWIYNSGQPDNGLGTNAHPMRPDEIKELLLGTIGIINVVRREAFEIQ